MSLIFQSLQKLETELDSAPVSPGEVVPEQGPAKGRIMRWLRPLIIGLALLLVLGCGAVYAVQYLKERIPENFSRASSQTQNHRAVPQRPAHDEPGDEMRAGSGQFEQPAPVDPSLIARAPATQPQFFPPVPGEPSAPPRPVAAVAAQPVEPEVPKADTVPAPAPRQAFKPEEIRPTRPAEVVDQGRSAADAQLEAAEKARRAALEKSARVGRLVRKIERALSGPAGSVNPQPLLEKLAGIKGEDHPYVVKLRSYWNFKRGKYKLAEADLRKVVAANPADYEAGINLALIEIHFHRYDEALARLKRLRNTHPENPQLADLIKRLR